MLSENRNYLARFSKIIFPFAFFREILAVFDHRWSQRFNIDLGLKRVFEIPIIDELDKEGRK